MLSGEESAADGRCAVVETSKHFHPCLQRSAPTLRGIARRSNLETVVPSLQPVRAELIKEAKAPASPQSTQLPVARVLRPQTAAERSTLTTDGTIDGGVKLTNVTVFATDPYPTVSDAARDCNRAAPCNLLPGFVGGESSRQPAPSVRACPLLSSSFSTCPLVKEAEFCARLRVPDGCPTRCEILWLLRNPAICLLHRSAEAALRDTLSLRDQLITDFLLFTVIQ
jgi:hypothetical protein